MKHREYDAIGL